MTGDEHTERPEGQEAAAEIQVLRAQCDSLRAALVRVLDTREIEAKAWATYETARSNFSGGAALESRRHLSAMNAASTAEREARTLLVSLKATHAGIPTHHGQAPAGNPLRAELQRMAAQFRSHPASRSISDIEAAGELMYRAVAALGKDGA